jgi:hypothetical protein
MSARLALAGLAMLLMFLVIAESLEFSSLGLSSLGLSSLGLSSLGLSSLGPSNLGPSNLALSNLVTQPVVPRAVRHAALMAVPGATPIAQRITAITARPLFRPDRRPVVAVQAGNNTSLPRLSGILIGAGLRLAIFADNSGKTRLTRQGDVVGGYRVSRIMPDHVTLTSVGASLGTRVVLTPRFAKTAGITSLSARPPALHPPVPQFHLPGKN